MTEIIHNEESNVDTLSDLFEERDRPGSKEEKPQKDLGAEEKEQPEQEVKEKAAPKDKEVSEVERLGIDLDKTRKSLEETKRFASKNARQLKEALKMTKGLLEGGALSEEEAQGLMNAFEGDHDEEEQHETAAINHPFFPLLKIADKEVKNIQKYTDDDTLDDKINAFNHFLTIASKEDLEEVFEELDGLRDDPVKLTKKMLSLGKKYYDEEYKDIKEAGSFRDYIVKQKKELDSKQKEIDKLKKKLSSYEDYDPSTLRLKEMGESFGEQPSQDTLSDLFAERDKVKRR